MKKVAWLLLTLIGVGVGGCEEQQDNRDCTCYPTGQTGDIPLGFKCKNASSPEWCDYFIYPSADNLIVYEGLVVIDETVTNLTLQPGAGLRLKVYDNMTASSQRHVIAPETQMLLHYEPGNLTIQSEINSTDVHTCALTDEADCLPDVISIAQGEVVTINSVGEVSCSYVADEYICTKSGGGPCPFPPSMAGSM